MRMYCSRIDSFVGRIAIGYKTSTMYPSYTAFCKLDNGSIESQVTYPCELQHLKHWDVPLMDSGPILQVGKANTYVRYQSEL